MARCTFCNQKNLEGARKCTGCGAELPDTADEIRATPPSTNLPSDVEQQIVALLRERQKIAAIKLHREATGLGLKESKDAIDAMERELGLSSGKAGCAGMLAVAALLFWCVCSYWN